jgi:elongator complex protein 2
VPLLLIGYENHTIEVHVAHLNESNSAFKFQCMHTLRGHEDWIRDLDIIRLNTIDTEEEQLLIASCSQDNYIRLWKLTSTKIIKKETSDFHSPLKANGGTSEGIDDNKDENEDEENEQMHQRRAEKLDEELKLKSTIFTVYSPRSKSNFYYSINLESVLYGHEDWIYSVKFQPKWPRDIERQPLSFVTASMDKTLVLWKYDEQNQIWIDSVSKE